MNRKLYFAVLMLVIYGCKHTETGLIPDGPFLKVPIPAVHLEASGRITQIIPVQTSSKVERDKIVFEIDKTKDTIEQLVYAMEQDERTSVLGKRAIIKTPETLAEKETNRKVIAPFSNRFTLISENSPVSYSDGKSKDMDRFYMEGKIEEAQQYATRVGAELLKIKFSPIDSNQAIFVFVSSLPDELTKNIVGKNFLFDPASGGRKVLGLLHEGPINYVYDFDYHFSEIQ